jgi:hypothetical protein
LKFLLPDITIGLKGKDEYRTIYSEVCHELAHASHFRTAGKEFWNSYITYVVKSYIMSGGMTYGDGTEEGAGYCEVGESWAFYMESLMYKDRYGGGFPSFGTSFWFYPQIFRYLDERGVSCSELFSVLDESVASREDLRASLIDAYPSKRSVIEQVFSRY